MAALASHDNTIRTDFRPDTRLEPHSLVEMLQTKMPATFSSRRGDQLYNNELPAVGTRMGILDGSTFLATGIVKGATNTGGWLVQVEIEALMFEISE